ncbi:hypothetical protein SKAU_G00153880 [Synaphobranchus kaupii]|uniref:Endoplasmic reticulum-Golgi intermediate compartment protein n=1 Tax=Synaphobranchus kaupii TaxID=118154 RepID=A0A9Q1IYQ0_SYNKA|nr:hypothetical protein SKAU_G00153880 [Synaphobranchus kaupii]
MYQYFVKIVPTIYVKGDGEVVKTNQFSVTRHEKVANGLIGDQGLPGVFVLYELSPMMVKFTEKNRSFTHFLTGVCAIIGGVFTVTSDPGLAVVPGVPGVHMSNGCSHRGNRFTHSEWVPGRPSRGLTQKMRAEGGPSRREPRSKPDRRDCKESAGRHIS